MRDLPLPLLLLATLAAAAPTAVRAKPRTLAESIAFVESVGKEADMSPRLAPTLGLVPPVHTTSVTYAAAATPDRRKHVYTVIHEEAAGKRSVTGLVWFITDIHGDGAARRLEGFIMRLDAEGRLLYLAKGAGPVGAVVQTPLAVGSPEAKAVLEDEKRFYAETAPALEPAR